MISNKHIPQYPNFAAQLPETGNGVTETGKWGAEMNVFYHIAHIEVFT